MNINCSTKEDEKQIKVLNKIINFVKKMLTKSKIERETRFKLATLSLEG